MALVDRKRRAGMHRAGSLVLQVLQFFPLASLVLTMASYCSGQPNATPFDFYSRGPYRQNVPRPQQILHYDVGEFHTNYAMMERALEAIAQAAPDRVRITDIGNTNEHRTMHLVVLTAPENLRQLDRIKTNVAKLADPRHTSAEQASQIVAETPLIVWLAYSVHGDESAAFEAMIQVVYQLAASDEPATLAILKNCVVLVNVCGNPDGHEAFVAWYNSIAAGNSDPSAIEHEEPWSLSGRLNHFRFDLNRDNIASSQIETQNMHRAFSEWRPQVLADHHGQQPRYFFPPSASPINPNLPRESTLQWLTTFGRANAAQFDARLWDYYVRDVFDLYYPGYWDSWSSLTGATGMTYETDGGGSNGINWRADDETIVTLRSGISKHFVASMTTLDTAAKHRADRLRAFYQFKRDAIEEGRSGRMKRIVLMPGTDQSLLADLNEDLLLADIEVNLARRPFRSEKAHHFDNDEPAKPRAFPAGAIVIDLAQPQGRLAKALLEPDTELDADFAHEQVARFKRNERRGANTSKEGYGFYDITAWSLPLAFGVEAYWTEDASALDDAIPLTFSTAGVTPNRSGIPTQSETVSAAAKQAGRAPIAYVIPYQSNGAAYIIFQLLRDGYKIGVTTRKLDGDGRSWPRGTVVARTSANPASLHDAIARLTTTTKVEIQRIETGFNEVGDTGIGSPAIVPLKRPRIIVIGDEPVLKTSYGSIWWTLDHYGIDFTGMTISTIKQAELDRYNVIILPDGSPDDYFSAFGKDGVDMLRTWCQRGGTLVGIKGGAAFLALKDVNFTSARLVGSTDDDQKPKEGSDEKATQPAQKQGAGMVDSEKLVSLLPPIASPSARPGEIPEEVPGAIVRATLDPTSPLTYGYEDEGKGVAVPINSGYFFRLSKEGSNAVVFDSDRSKPLRIAGFVWPGNTEKLLHGSASVIEEKTGRGHVVLYSEDLNFRGLWRATSRLFFNSFLFQPAF